MRRIHGPAKNERNRSNLGRRRDYGSSAGKFGNALEAMTDGKRVDIPQCERVRVSDSDRADKVTRTSQN